jgi:hypothetical protein
MRIKEEKREQETKLILHNTPTPPSYNLPFPFLNQIDF